MDVLEWIQAAKKFNTNEFLNDISYDVYEDNRFEEIQKKQWEKGLSSKGEEIGYYKKNTEEITGGRKKYGELWNLNDSGDFWNKTILSTKVKKKDIIFDFDSDSKNKRKLFSTIRKFGLIEDPKDIFGLYEPYIEELNKLLEPKFVEQLEKYYNNV